ncbi:MAG TPA: heavy metal-associated domain-containing protein [Bacteroidales bacterium]|nr:heavy metal-associated domain-containing protein [Bacteroidales bacterium]
MKNRLIKIIIFIELLTMISYLTYGQDTSKIKKIEIKVSLQCEMCKERILNDLSFEKGIKDIDVDIKAKTVTVTYHQDKTTPEKIRTAISKIGYDADDVPADPEAYSKLPKCCQKGGHD